MTQGVTKIAEASAAVSEASDQTANEAVQGKEKFKKPFNKFIQSILLFSMQLALFIS